MSISPKFPCPPHLVTGASAGIGRATAILLSRQGALVTIGGRDKTRLAETLALLEGGGHTAAPFDLADLDAIPGWMKELATQHGPFHGVAHCAGIQTLRPIRVFSAAFFEEVMRINLGSALAIAKSFRQKGVHAEQASLVFIASTAATAASPANVVYAASKGGIIATVEDAALLLDWRWPEVARHLYTAVDDDLDKQRAWLERANARDDYVHRIMLIDGRPVGYGSITITRPEWGGIGSFGVYMAERAGRTVRWSPFPGQWDKLGSPRKKDGPDDAETEAVFGGVQGEGGAGGDPWRGDGVAVGGQARGTPDADQRLEEAGDGGDGRGVFRQG